MRISDWSSDVCSSDLLAELEGRLAALPVDVCIDHMGQINVHQWADDQGFKCLSRLLVAGRTWIKLCGYRASQAGPPYADLQAPARALIESAPNRCVWGTDWPHPMFGNSPMPDDVKIGRATCRERVGQYV